MAICNASTSARFGKRNLFDQFIRWILNNFSYGQLSNSRIVLGHSVAVAVPKKGGGMMKKDVGGNPREAFRRFFHADADDDVGVVEDYAYEVPQVLRLINSPRTNNSIEAVTKFVKAGEPEKVIESMYVAILSRQPSATELTKMKNYAAADRYTAKAYRDLFWVLLNSGEFLFNH